MIFYKNENGKELLSLKTPLADTNGYTEINEQEFLELTAKKEPTAEQKAKWREIAVIKQEIAELEKWFSWYDIQVNQYQRALRNGVRYDKNIIELDTLAFVKAERIKDLRSKVGE